MSEVTNEAIAHVFTLRNECEWVIGVHKMLETIEARDGHVADDHFVKQELARSMARLCTLCFELAKED
jgi:hypothetical protein